MKSLKKKYGLAVSFVQCVILVKHTYQSTCSDNNPSSHTVSVVCETSFSSRTTLFALPQRLLQEIDSFREGCFVYHVVRLQSEAFTEGGATVAVGYEDKAAERRRTKGSDNPYQKDDESSSVDRYASCRLVFPYPEQRNVFYFR